MNNSEIRASQQELHKTLRELAVSVETFATDVSNTLTEITKSIKELGTSWEGEGYDKFKGTMEREIEKGNKGIKLAKELNGKLAERAKEAEQFINFLKSIGA